MGQQVSCLPNARSTASSLAGRKQKRVEYFVFDYSRPLSEVFTFIEKESSDGSRELCRSLEKKGREER